MMLAPYRLSAQLHLKSLLRLPAYWVPTLLFPVMLYVMFGTGGCGIASDYRMASFVVYGVIGVSLTSSSVSRSPRSAKAIGNAIAEPYRMPSGRASWRSLFRRWFSVSARRCW